MHRNGGLHMNGKVELARGFIWAADLTDSELERAAQGITERTYNKGAYICHRGDRLDHWGGIVEGLIKMSTIGRSGKAVTFAGLGNGAWFGEGSVIKNEARKYDLVALRETRLALMNRPTFLWLFENSIGFNHYLLRQINEQRHEVENEYTRVVKPEGNLKAQALVGDVFELRSEFEWRGLGTVPYSALKIRESYAAFDAEKRFALSEKVSREVKSCECPAILRGAKKPTDCKLFGTVCTPDNPMGSCMVSSEGACAAYWTYGRFRTNADGTAATKEAAE